MKNKTTLKTKISSFVKTIKAWSLATFTRDKSLNNFTKAGVVIGLSTTPIVFVACLPTEKPNDNEQNSSGDQIQSGDKNPSGDTNKDPENPSNPDKPTDPTKPTDPEKPTDPTEPEKPAIPGDENYDYPTTMAELEASPDKIKLQQLLTNYIDENLKENLVSRGFGSASVKNTVTIAYDIKVDTKSIKALFKTTLEEKDVYFTTNGITEEKIDLEKIFNFQAKKERDLLNESEKNQPQFLNIDIRATSKGFNFAVQRNANEFSKDAERIYKYLTGEEYENATYFAENLGAIPAFGSGFWPVVRTTAIIKENGTFKIKYIEVVAKDYNTIGTENEKEYENKGNDEFTFGSENTIYMEDLKEKEDETVIVTVDNKEYALIKDNQTYFIEQ